MRRLVLLGLLAGCAAAPPPLSLAIPYAVLPTAPARAEPRRPGAPFATTRPSPSPEEGAFPIDLPTALRLAGARSLALALARERGIEAEERAREAAYGFLPVLRPRISAFRHEGLTQGTAGEFLDVEKQSAFLGTGADLTLDFGGALFRALAARRLAEASSAGAAAAESAVALDVIARHFALVVARDAVRIETEAVSEARALLEFEESRLRLGAGLEADAMRARANLAEAEGRLAEGGGAWAAASAALVRALHIEPGTSLVPLEEPGAPVERAPISEEPAALVARALERRPEIAAARARAEAALSEESGARVGPLIPRLRLEASYGAFGENLGFLRDQEVYRASLEWDLGAALLPAAGAAHSRARQATLELASAGDAVAEEVVQARARALAARERVFAAEARVRAAEEALRLADARLRGGAGLLLEVLDAQTALTAARTERTRAAADFEVSQFRLLHALGELQAGA